MPTLTFTANPSEIQSGGRTTVSWSTTNATSCTPIPGTSGAITGEVSYTLTENTTFPMACTGPGGSVSKNITVTVSQVQPTKLADGVECSSYDQCQSNYCYAGPENKKYCVNRDLNCAQPGTAGVTFGSTYVYNGAQYQCNTDSSVTKVSSSGAETNLASAVAALVQRQPAQSAPSKFMYTFTLDLWRGQEGTEVRALQEALREEGLYDGEITGGFFDLTKAAVTAFQTKYGINPTGYVGPATRAQLNALFSL